MRNQHTSTGVTMQAVRWAFARVNARSLKSPSPFPLFFTLSFSPPLSPPFFFFFFFGFSVYLCARACIWHLSSGLRVMPWSCRKLGHCFMYAVRCPMWETPSLCMSVRVTGNSATTGFSLLTHVYPKTNKLSFPPPPLLQTGCNNKKSNKK